MATISGQYKFNSTLTFKFNGTQAVNFTSNGKSYTSIGMSTLSGYDTLVYKNGSTTQTVYMWDADSTFVEDYRIVDFGDTDQTVTDTFYNFMSLSADPIAPPTVTYNIGYNLSNCSASSNNPTTIESGATVTLSFLAYGGYVLPDILTCSGASVVTWTGAGKADGTLTIQNPTGNVTITVTATVKPKVYKRVGYYNDDVKEVALTFSNNKLSGAISLQGGGSIPIPETDLSSVGYTLPVATGTVLGGVKVVVSNDQQTEYVGIMTDNRLVTRQITKVTNVTGTLTNGVLTIEISLDNGSTVSGTVNLQTLANVEMIELTGIPSITTLTPAICNQIILALDAEKLPVLVYHNVNGTETMFIVMEYHYFDDPDEEKAEMYISHSTGYYRFSGTQYPGTNGFESVQAVDYLNNASYVPSGLLQIASTSRTGVIKAQAGSSDGQNFPVQVNADGTAFINIPIYNGEVS